MQIKSDNVDTIYLILDGSKTTNKESFLREIALLLKFPEDYEQSWGALNECLFNIQSIWENENPEYIEPVSDEHGIIPTNLVVKVIWNDPLDFGEYNPEDFRVAISILKEIGINKDNPLEFILASNVNNIDI